MSKQGVLAGKALNGGVCVAWLACFLMQDKTIRSIFQISITTFHNVPVQDYAQKVYVNFNYPSTPTVE